MEKYKLYQSKIILNDPQSFSQECYLAHKHFTQLLPNLDSTNAYEKYNIFSLTCSSLLFYELYKELNYHIRSYIGDDRPLWMESWLNFHSPDKVLKKHGHGFLFHGYVSVDPKSSTTVFEKYEIDNKIGQIYIGPGGEGYEHYVKVNKPYNGKRITIGFDVTDIPNNGYLNLGLIPLL